MGTWALPEMYSVCLRARPHYNYNIHTYIRISYTMGTSALPDMYACIPKGCRPKGKCVYTGRARVPVLPL